LSYAKKERLSVDIDDSHRQSSPAGGCFVLGSRSIEGLALGRAWVHPVIMPNQRDPNKTRVTVPMYKSFQRVIQQRALDEGTNQVALIIKACEAYFKIPHRAKLPR
jgi:hypothetical protein